MALITVVLVFLHLSSIYCQTFKENEDCDYKVADIIYPPPLHTTNKNDGSFTDWIPYSSDDSTGDGWLENAFIPMPLWDTGDSTSDNTLILPGLNSNDTSFDLPYDSVHVVEDSGFYRDLPINNSGRYPMRPIAMPAVSHPLNTVSIARRPQIIPLYKGPESADGTMDKMASTTNVKPLKKKKAVSTTTATAITEAAGKIRLRRKRPVSAMPETTTIMMPTMTTRQKLKRKITTTTESFRKRRTTTSSLTD
ncbi:uncharacterized protein LOC110674464 isoform X2 [Aedes aegypti]|uniref:Uncharacterized protein n=1 Tax=Aedes aegypti TaxID=7159 RepID=A0A6I8TNZ4_AEDAE|nr:uncharacterized protein LOC110674464 isoform X2 [Aedes aegypti]